MKNVKTVSSYFFMLLLIAGCSSGNYVVSEKGDIAEIIRIDGYSFNCELVAIQDTAIIFSLEHQNKNILPKLYYEPLANIKSVKIKGYADGGWIGPLILFQVIPAALLTGAALSVDSENGSAVAVFIIPIISALLFSGSDEDMPQWDNEQSMESIIDLNKYCRYPLGINATLLSQLLKQNGQTMLIRIIKR